jgi:hypothetical protein
MALSSKGHNLTGLPVAGHSTNMAFVLCHRDDLSFFLKGN